MRAASVSATHVLAVGCGGGGPAETATTAAPPPRLPTGGEPAHLDPADFVTRIDNPWWPMAPGSRWVYRESGADGKEQRVEVTVTDRTNGRRRPRGARLVHDALKPSAAAATSAGRASTS